MLFKYYIKADGSPQIEGILAGTEADWSLPQGAVEYATAEALQAAIAANQTPAPDWPAVRTALLNDLAYNAAVEAALNQRAVSRLEQYALQSPDNWGMLAYLWNGAIASVPSPNPLLVETGGEHPCDRINALFATGHLPITLNRDTALMEAPP